MMMMRTHTDERKSLRIGTLRRAARAIGALLARVPLPAAKAEQKPWTETLRFPPF
jgi:hypothetical protein